MAVGGEDEVTTTARADGLPPRLLAEIARDAHRYARGLDHRRPTSVAGVGSRVGRAVHQAREVLRDRVERAAARAGFTRRHYDPDVAGDRLARLVALSDGLAETRALLADDESRRALDDVLKLRVLGPYHAPLPVTPQLYRAKQAHVDRELRTQAATFEVSDPWFSPLSLYRVPISGGSPVSLHSHSVDVVSVFLLDQYRYMAGARRVSVEQGDVVLDVGGCWGDTALYFASLVGPTGRVYTFEFDPESLEIMRANLALNPELADRIEIVEKALWERSGDTLQFVQAGRMSTLLPDGAGRGGLPVATITLDDFVQQAGLERLDFVKMDVEGAELSVLRGARGALGRFAPRLAIAAYHKDDDLVTLPAAIAAEGAGYRFHIKSASAVEDETVLFATAEPQT